MKNDYWNSAPLWVGKTSVTTYSSFKTNNDNLYGTNKNNSYWLPGSTVCNEENNPLTIDTWAMNYDIKDNNVCKTRSTQKTFGNNIGSNYSPAFDGYLGHSWFILK